MDKEKAIIIFNIKKKNYTVDLEVPLDISANELVNSLNITLFLALLNYHESWYILDENSIVRFLIT